MEPASRPARVVALALTLTCGAPEDVGCLGSGDPACVPPSPCGALTYACAPTSPARAYRVERAAQRPPGLDALASVGDLVLENGLVTAVVDAVDHPHHLATSGGHLLDLVPRGGEDHLNAVYAVTGILPRDSVKYTSLEVVNAPGAAVAVARGALDGDPRVSVVTRYELRDCDPGVRVRTELFNGGRTTGTWFVADVWYWGDRGMTPFIPVKANNFVHPPLDLLEIDASWRSFPWMAASSHSAPDTSYATLSCTRDHLEGIQDSTVSAVGLPLTIVRPGDGAVFERMIFTAAGGGIGGAQRLAAEAHATLHLGAVTRLTGRVTGAPLRDDRTTSVLAYEPAPEAPDDALAGTVRAQVVPDADGRFALTVPRGASVRVQVHRFGRAVTTSPALTAAQPETSVGDLALNEPAHVAVTVRDAAGMPIAAEVLVVPVESVTPRERVVGTMHGTYRVGCAPYLGAPFGGAPACNRALAFDGTTRFDAPPGTYWVYATAGPAHTLARTRVELREGMTSDVALQLRRLDGVFPSDALSGDFHVHGGRSFDTEFPDRDRVQSFVTAGVDVIVSTDHDVANGYAEAVRSLGVGDRVVVMPGVETTQLVPFLMPPGDTFPRVIGHFNFWPMPVDTAAFNNGMPWDERIEPGQLFDRIRPLLGDDAVMELNHPTAESKAGRDEGYLRMLGYNPGRALPAGDDGSAVGMIWRRPGGAGAHRNLDWQVQEAMNGSDVVLNLTYRAFWFSMLNQGLLRAGTANSDSHSLVTEQLGYPRNVVAAGFPRSAFDRARFNRAVREGRMVGTNGPYIAATVPDASGAARGPSVEPFAPMPNASLAVEVRAAPWVPVTEVRVVVNGVVVRTVSGAAIARPADPFGTDGVVRWRGSFPLAALTGGRDAWIVVEAGLPLPAARDLDDDDGLIDHIDGDGDGEVDDRHLARPTENDPRFHVDVVSPGTLPTAFTNPFVVDLDGGGWRAPR